MKCVECGQITLDEPIDKPLPELAKLPIMQKGEGSNSPFTLVPASQSIALRHLLTYASGMTYDMMDPTVMAWRACHGEGTVAMLGNITGEGWKCGTSLDWASLLVGRLNNTTLGEHAEKNIFKPLGMALATFHMAQKPSVVERLIHLLKNSPVLLENEAVDLLFTPQNADGSSAHQELMARNDSTYRLFVGGSAEELKFNHGLGGFLVTDDIDNPAYYNPKANSTLTWSGLPNLAWSVNREKDRALKHATQIFLWGDEKNHDLTQAFETAVWRNLDSVA
ncbi:beta-lactamase/transpeptidase-like protein [Lepidopterella palustris CBS 459.81]|uniref:Beta-lactamase/transpeptidase-like protein n=1 Tax=Lepidopterella palustris CBS 459.81 TaxID=1314670 RepID=A0A8E2E825_9PEZI|nr:beta-lactamase/transpeptidase-like protein [Lepidopterella palustris CBS 459.81]